MIMYHGTPLGGRSTDRPAFFQGRHAIVPFPRQDDLHVVAECCDSFAFDNGAFSAWRSGSSVQDWYPYYKWCREWIRHPGFDWAIIPDVIEGTERDNDQQMVKWINWDGWRGGGVFAANWSGVSRFWLEDRSVPVWHLHESIERLQRLAATWPRICFGSSGDYSDPGSEKWTNRIHQAWDAICIEGKPVCKVHGLRMADPAIFHRYPFASVDSTNVAQNSARESRRHGCSPELAREIIARRIEQHNSAEAYEAADRQRTLVFK